MGVDVSRGLVGDSTRVREEAGAEGIPESLLSVLTRFGLFGAERDCNVSLGKGKELFSSIVNGLIKVGTLCSIKRP